MDPILKKQDINSCRWVLLIIGFFIGTLLANIYLVQSTYAQITEIGSSNQSGNNSLYILPETSIQTSNNRVTSLQHSGQRSNFKLQSELSEEQLSDEGSIETSLPEQSVLSHTISTSELGDNQSLRDFDFEVSSASILSGLEVGGTIYNDTNRNGIKDSNESGIRNVDIEIYADTDGDNWPNGPVLATANSGLSGNYRFSGLADGDYVMNIATSFFEDGQALDGLVVCPPSSTSSAPIDPDNNVDGDNNAVEYVTAIGIRTARTLGVTLSSGAEPTTEDGDANTNLTVDLCLYSNYIQTPTLPNGEPDLFPEAVDDEYLREIDTSFAENIVENDTAGNGPLLVRFVSGVIAPGLTLNAGGDLAGTLTQAGVYIFEYEISDYDGDSSTAFVTVTVETDLLPLAVDDSESINVGDAVTLDICANDFVGSGFGSVAYVSGDVAPGLTLADCILSGNPTIPGIFIFVYELTDTDGDKSTATVTIDVNALPVAVDDSDSIATNSPYSLDICANDSFGDGFGSVSFLSGTIPPGLALVDCILTGTPTTPGPYSFEYELTDIDGDTDSATVTINVNLLPDAVDDSATGTINTPFSLNICTNDDLGDGLGSIAYTSGVIPPGLSLTECLVTGTPTTFGETVFEYELTDSNGDTDRAFVTITIAAEGTITIVKQTTSGDATFSFNSNDADLNVLRITTSNGTGSGPTFTKIADTYTISEEPQIGWKLDTISISGDTNNNSSTSGNSATIELDPNENIVITFIGSPISSCADGTNNLGGIVWRDRNSNGIQDTDDTGFYDPAITVYVFDASNVQIASTQLNSDGTYFFGNIFSITSNVRLEFSGLPSWVKSSVASSDNGTMVQIHSADTCSADLAVHNPSNYCEDNPAVATSCFVSSDPESASGPFDVLVSWPYERQGNNVNAAGWVPPTLLAKKGDIGSVWGLTYARESNTLYSATFLKRHVGLKETNPVGGAALNNPLGVIYATDVDAGTNRVFIDLSTAGIDVGTIGNNAERGVDVAPNKPSLDADAYALVGKIGLGDIDMLADESTLYAVNLNQKELVSVDINADGTAGAVRAYSIPNPSCTNGEHRPFALKVYQDDVYVGVVCDGSASDNDADLSATVYRWDGGANFTNMITFSLDYTKGNPRGGSCSNVSGWFAWRDTFPTQCQDTSGGFWDEVVFVYPQPILSDIEFDIDGSMVLGFMDRLGHQMGFRNATLTDINSTNNITTIGGDVLRVYNNNGTYELENNGTAGPFTTSGDNNGQGPGGGEFYYKDDGGGHQENSVGGLSMHPGQSELFLTMIRPGGGPIGTGGVVRFESTTGKLVGSYALYQGGNNSDGGANLTAGYFGKAAGLGDIELMCSAAPIEIGNYVWLDSNNDGIQDPNENGIAGITVDLYDSSGTQIATVNTDGQGQYAFNASNVSGGLSTRTQYQLRIDLAQQTVLGMVPTQPNLSVSSINPDSIDSDGTQENGFAVANITTSGAGQNNHSVDFGLTTTQGMNCSNTNMQEAEDALLSGSFVRVTANDGASGGEHIWVPEGTGNEWNGANDANKALFCIEVAEAGRYRVVGETNGPNGMADSFFVTVGGLPENGYLWDVKRSTGYVSDYVNHRGTADPVEVILSAGQHIIGVYLREDGTKLDKIGLELVEAITPADSCGAMEQEAEDGALYGNFLAYTDNTASGNMYAGVENDIGNNMNGATTIDRAEYCFSVPEDGVYKLIGTVQSNPGGNNSFYVTVDEAPAQGYLWDTTTSSGYIEDDLRNRDGQNPVLLNLTAGNHTVVIYLREDGTKLDKLKLVQSTALNAASTQTPSSVELIASENVVLGKLHVSSSYVEEPELAGHTVWLSGNEIYETVTNHIGGYYMDDVPDGTYDLTITVPIDSGEATLEQTITIGEAGSESVETNFNYEPPAENNTTNIYLPTIR